MIPSKGEVAEIDIYIDDLDIRCLGHTVSTDAIPVQGKVYSLDDRAQVDVVTWITPGGEEIELRGPYGTYVEDMLWSSLWAEAHTPNSIARLEEAFEDFIEGKKQDARERRDQLRVVAAE